MSKKGGIFFEEHIEKVVLIVVGFVCLWLFVTRALFSPNKVLYDNKKLSPSKIDIHIRHQSEILEYEKLNSKPEPKPLYEPQRGEFIAMLDSSIRDVDISVPWPLPGCSSTPLSDNRRYHLPQVSKIGKASVEHIRAVAYVPTKEISKETLYRRGNSEPNDIDFVTVESTIDIAGLSNNFHQSFAGENVSKEWRDPCLANPVFAAVQLQRQELLADGSSSDWQTVPRTRIDHHEEMFEIIEEAEELPPGGVKVRLLNFDNRQAMMDLLQPEAYRIASAEEEWFPPTVHKKYAKYQKEAEMQEKREAKEAERKKREQEREKLREERLGTRSRTMSNPGRIGRRYDDEDSRSTRGSARALREDRGLRPEGRRRRPITERKSEMLGAKKKTPEKTKKVAKVTSMSDFYDEYNKLLITETTDIAKMREPLAFWAHDDTVEPGRSYRYRIRLGVFNPIAGTDQVREQDRLQKNNVILWSNFSDETETVKIPAKLYFFPHRIREAAEIVWVKVCRYALGYWYSEDFRVKQGEVIGKVEVVKSEDVDVESVEQKEKKVNITIPETVDYSTGAIYVDAVLVNNWAGGKNMRAMRYYDMLYSFDGANIEHMPIDRSYWGQELQTKFSEIEELEKKQKKPLRDWGARPTERKRVSKAAKGKAGEEKTGRQDRDRDRGETEAFQKMLQKRRGGR